jgi:CrcB protein
MQQRTVAVLVGVGGAAGASARWAVFDAIELSTSFPVATLAINLSGCFLLGLVFDRASESVQAAVGTGFCGGLTTFSTFAVEVVDLAERGEGTVAAAYLLVSVAVGIGAVALARRVMSVRS